MKRLLTIIALAGAVFGATAATSTADAHASSYKRCSGHTSGWTRGGYTFVQSSYRGYRGMNCASVRYAAKHLRRAVSRQWGWPDPGTSFFDGYVRWHCYQHGSGGYSVTCNEYSSGTAFRVRFGVYYH